MSSLIRAARTFASVILWLLLTLLLLITVYSWYVNRAYLTSDKAETISTTTTVKETPPATPNPPTAKSPSPRAAPAASPTVTRETMTKQETTFRQPIWVTLAQPILGAAAGLIALWQFMDKRKQEKEHFDRKEQEDRFKDIQDRFASTDPRTRANAALRLAEMARVAKPGAVGKPISAENNPFFLRAAAPLAIALHMEENDSVRAANKKAIGNLVVFVEEKDKEKYDEGKDCLLRALIKDMYEANLTARQAFIKALAQFWPDESTGEEPDYEFLFIAARFCPTEISTKTTICSLTESDTFKLERQVYAKSVEQVEPKESKSDALIAATIRQTANRLMETRDALALGLCALSRPKNLPSVDATWEEWFKYSQLNGLELKLAFLAGALLENAQLQGVRLIGAYLNGSILSGGQFVGAELAGAQLAGATVREVLAGHLRTDFSKSTWKRAHFTYSNGREDMWIRKWFVKNYGDDEDKAELAAQEAAGKARDC